MAQNVAQKLIEAHLVDGDMRPGAEHHYAIVEPFTAVEATSPPAQVHGRDDPH